MGEGSIFQLKLVSKSYLNYIDNQLLLIHWPLPKINQRCSISIQKIYLQDYNLMTNQVIA